MAAEVVQQRFLTLRGVATELGMSVESVRDWVLAGKLKGYRPGGKQILISRVELEQFLEESTKVRCTPPWMRRTAEAKIESNIR
jgi:excisionase family DNA binding protein